MKLNVPIYLRRGKKKGNQAKHLASATWLINLLCQVQGVENLSEIELLDMGCGTKLVQAILDNQIPIGRYVGVDIYKEMIDFLSAEVDDPRFSFYHMNFHNEMYNPEGEPLDGAKGLPFSNYDQFDLICLFSVFTHLAPHDFNEMLKLLRPHIKPQGKLVFSLFVNEVTEEGHGLIDGIAKHLKKKGQGSPENESKERNPPPPFLDLNPKKPLEYAVYAREYALELMEGTGWNIDSLNDPEKHIQHYMICSPA